MVNVCVDFVDSIYGIVIGLLLWVVLIGFIVGVFFRIICVLVLLILNDDILVCCGWFGMCYGCGLVNNDIVFVD